MILEVQEILTSDPSFNGLDNFSVNSRCKAAHAEFT